jgi:hypothetical protein
MSLAEIQSAIERLPFEERAKLMEGRSGSNLNI